MMVAGQGLGLQGGDGYDGLEWRNSFHNSAVVIYMCSYIDMLNVIYMNMFLYIYMFLYIFVVF